ncbi:MAG: hypothetical protein ACPGTU_15515 [Myxococcota bacterium]
MLKTLMLLLCLPLGGRAFAGGFEARTMRGSLSALEVERPLVIGKGWLEAGFGLDVKRAEGFWDEDGEAQDFARSDWLYTTQRLTVRYGLSKRTELWWNIPTHYAELTNNKLNTNTSKFGLGDPSFGFKAEVYRGSAPTTSLITEVFYKAPAGDDSPGSFIGGPNTFDNIVMSTGTPDMGVGVQGKRQYGPFAFELGASYTRRFSRAVGYLIETEFHQFQARIKPGDLIDYNADVLVQIGPVAIHNRWFIQQRFETLIGTASPGLFGDKNLEPVDGSDGGAIDTSVGAVFNLTRGVDVLFDVRQPLVGEDLQFFPIEQIHPTRGTTISTAVELRY